MSQHVISIQEIIVIALTMAKRTDFVERPAPVVVPTPRVAIQTTQNMHITSQDHYRSRPIYEVSSFSHGKCYRNDLSDANKCW